MINEKDFFFQGLQIVGMRLNRGRSLRLQIGLL